MNLPATTGNSPELAIRIINLGKSYRIFRDPKDRLKQAIWRSRRTYYKEFWALRNISFDVHRGETLGILGRNGSGKSTLLQLICRTLSPSEGNVTTNGRIAALLELGSGFNPEFTGIENVYLNASLLGLSQAETNERLDAILAFADIGEFVNQPVKTYSSGMAVRLAFAVITQVEPDILIVDEALSVGDAFFVQKCMRFIHRFREHGCLLFVSHDISAVSSICDRALLISNGRMQRLGSAKLVTQEYIKDIFGEPDLPQVITEVDVPTRNSSATATPTVRRSNWIDYRKDRINNSNLANYLEISQFEEQLLTAESFGNGKAEIQSVLLLDAERQQPIAVGLGGENVVLRIQGKANADILHPVIGFLLKNDKGLILFGENTINTFQVSSIGQIKSGQEYWAEFEFTLPLLPPGNYSFTISLADGSQTVANQLHWLNDALILRSDCQCIGAGVAGVAMQRISMELHSKS
jgi:lipopolysaccharide transport system ATP-binding protein